MYQTLTIENIKELDKISRLNLVNSCTGFKSANLIVTSSETHWNVAIFSSVVHLGSDPAMLGIIFRPTTVPRNTLQNMLERTYFTVNHIAHEQIIDAHHTSAKYDYEVSEFDQTNLEPELIDTWKVAAVKNSPVQLYCSYANSYPIAENDTIFVVAKIEAIRFQEEIQHPDGWLDLSKSQVVTINGLDGYCSTKLIQRQAYARPKKQL
jgi:flavin reductase (DIM6/NTAB) family NADH-FMN oxidoreductase RutF